MSRNTFLCFGTALSLLLAVAPVLAHHSFAAEYDSNKLIAFTGQITKVQWQNPHTYFYVDVKDENGKIMNYAVEGGPPNSLYRQGWRKDSLKIGDIVKIEGWRAKDGSNHVNGRNFMFPDGRKIFAGSSNGDPATTTAPAVGNRGSRQ